MKTIKKSLATILSLAIILSVVSMVSAVSAEARGNVVWELTYDVSGDIATFTHGMDRSRFPLSEWTGYDGSQSITEEYLWGPSPDYAGGVADESDVNTFPIRLYASFITMNGWQEFFVPFFQWNPLPAGSAPEGVYGQLRQWGISSDNVVSILGGNATSQPIRLRLVKYDGDLDPVPRQHRLQIMYRDLWFSRPGLSLPSSNQYVETGEQITLNANNFSVDGFTFLGWNTRADGTGTHFNDQATFIYDRDVDMMLYAQWEEIVDKLPDTGTGTNPDTGTGTNPDTGSNPDPTIPDDEINDALEDDEPFIKIPEGSCTIISQDSLQAIKNSGKVLEVELPNGILIRIDPDLITDIARSIDLNIGLSFAEQETTVDGIQFPANSIIIAPSAHGEFGFTISFDISADMLAEAGLNVNNVRLFHISTDGTVTEHDGIVRNVDGSVTISISHASRWLLSVTAPQIIRATERETERPPHNVPQTGVDRRVLLPIIALTLGIICIVGAEFYRRQSKIFMRGEKR
jgi:hypothetical protein